MVKSENLKDKLNLSKKKIAELEDIFKKYKKLLTAIGKL